MHKIGKENEELKAKIKEMSEEYTKKKEDIEGKMEQLEEDLKVAKFNKNKLEFEKQQLEKSIGEKTKEIQMISASNIAISKTLDGYKNINNKVIEKEREQEILSKQ